MMKKNSSVSTPGSGSLSGKIRRTGAFLKKLLYGSPGRFPADASYGWDEIAWKYKLLEPQARQGVIKRGLMLLKSAGRDACPRIAEDPYEDFYRLDSDKGKVTDCGEDRFACIYTCIPADPDFSFEAEITVNRFLHEPGPTNQEAFGLFIRDTMDRNSPTGLYYGNMAAVGGYYGRLNFFGRSGIVPGDAGHLSNFFLYPRVNRQGSVWYGEPLSFMITPETRKTFRLLLTKRDGTVTARLEDRDGKDLLSSMVQRDEPVTENGIIVSEEGNRIEAPFRPGCPFLYAGFLVTADTEILINKKTVRLTFTEARKRSRSAVRRKYPEDPFRAPVRGWDRDDPAGCSAVRYAAVNGTPEGAGTRGSPLDIYSAVEKCAAGGTVVLAAGRYVLDRSVVLGGDHAVTRVPRRHLVGETGENKKVILDFQGSENCLQVSGDFWNVENIRVTNGFGIRISGSYNRLKRCFSCRNFETGILIRHPENDSPRADWPCYNLVEDCVSFYNRDRSECNADGFACKVASGEGNTFLRCVSWMNSDDGFDLFTKNRRTGAVLIRECESYLNGYKTDAEGNLVKTGGNGNGFKLGGSGMRVEHRAVLCTAERNRTCGFTNNSNPYMLLDRCRASDNGKKNAVYSVYDGTGFRKEKKIINCSFSDNAAPGTAELLKQLQERYDGG